MVEPGWWTTYRRSRRAHRLSAQSIGGFLATVAVPTSYAVLRNDGRVTAGFAWTNPTSRSSFIGVVRTGESTRKLARRVEAGTARIRSATLSYHSPPASLPPTTRS